nr:MAG TPA: hypothetical protein [Caudoviricetes sp.]
MTTEIKDFPLFPHVIRVFSRFSNWLSITSLYLIIPSNVILTMVISFLLLPYLLLP